MAYSINLRQERGFEQRFNAVFIFFQQNFKTLISCLVGIAVPIGLAAGYFSGINKWEALSQFQHIDHEDHSQLLFNNVFPELFSFTHLLAVLLSLLSYIIAVLVVYAYVAEY